MVAGAYLRKEIRVGAAGELRHRVATYREEPNCARRLVPPTFEFHSCRDVAVPDECRGDIADESETGGAESIRRDTEAFEIRQDLCDASGIESAAMDNRRHGVVHVD